MMQRFTMALALVASSAYAYPDAADIESVKEWDDLAKAWGFDYEKYTVTTEDSWELTLFRITGKVGEPAVATDKAPILLQHGNLMDAQSWMSFYSQDGGYDPMPVQLVSQGYDVWMGNSRGTKYSSVNSAYPDAEHDHDQNFARYDYTYFEMGMYDLPAEIDKIIEVTQQPKITYVGYSMGTAQILYGLAQMEDTYYAEKLSKAVLMAPCIFGAPSTKEDYNSVFPEWRKLGINAVLDENWEYNLYKICHTHDATVANPACDYAKSLQGEAVSVKALELYAQNAIADRWQVYNPDFATAEDVTSELVTPGLASIETVPVQMMVANNDSACPAEKAKQVHDEIPSMTNYFVLAGDNDHDVFAWNNFPDFMEELVEQIEYQPATEVLDTKETGSGASYVTVMGSAMILSLSAALF